MPPIEIPFGQSTLTLPDEVAAALPTPSGTPVSVGRSGASVLAFGDVFLKAERVCPQAENEHAALNVLRGVIPIPERCCSLRENGVLFLVTRRLAGRMTCAPECLATPRETVRLLARGLETLWRGTAAAQSLPASRRGVTLEDKLGWARDRVSRGEVDWASLPEELTGRGGFPSAEALWRELSDNRPDEQLALSHGDYCLPNVFAADGRVTGFCDLGHWGLADPWQDIALCVRSLAYNVGFSCREMLLTELGVAPDAARERYYLWLDELF